MAKRMLEKPSSVPPSEALSETPLVPFPETKMMLVLAGIGMLMVLLFFKSAFELKPFEFNELTSAETNST